jgi:DNA (cytosine-5)-methyltransferase 1
VARDLGVAAGNLALLAACAPCQGFSRLRTLNRAGAADDDRNDLVLRVLPFITALRPRAVMLENVPGAEKAPQMADVRRRLHRLGYRFRDAVLDVADYGVPQRRRRYILIGTRGAAPEFPRLVHRRRTVRDAIGHLPDPGRSGDPLHDVASRTSPRIARLIARIPTDGGSRSALPRRIQLDCHRACDGFSDVYGRMAWDGPAPTITSGFVNPSKGRFLHPEQNRAITPREAALLQSFPASYEFSMTRGKYAAAEMIGNAVPPAFARRQARALLRALG